MPDDSPRRNVRPIERPQPRSPVRSPVQGSELAPVDQPRSPARIHHPDRTVRNPQHTPIPEEGGGDSHTHQHIHLHIQESQPQYISYSWRWTSTTTYYGSNASPLPPAPPSMPASESLIASAIVRCAQLIVWLGIVGAGVWITGKSMNWF
ncbi:MAG: hypothetical protein KC996_06785 [Phycisphaerales bacterium]|nr:hypothetical protein [Phycisphaerales bacterium]